MGIKSPMKRVAFARTICTPITDIVVSVSIIATIGTQGADLMSNALGIGVGVGMSSRIWDSATRILYGDIHQKIDEAIESANNAAKEQLKRLKR